MFTLEESAHLRYMLRFVMRALACVGLGLLAYYIWRRLGA
jgi:hypothetical protein